ncbi:MAG: tRNA pseudouridine(13) synthase TruD [Chloroflexi bacterium]|nr:tRNA pseudouridine(13) synthase TruD [Chloroflexota bacterium]
MRFKAQPGDFVVSERLRQPPAASGGFALLRVRKRGLTTLDVQNRLAAKLGIANQHIVFPGLKDKDAVTTQYATVALGPARLGRAEQVAWPSVVSSDSEFSVEFAGYRERALQATDLAGNTFTLVVRDLGLEEAQRLAPRLAQLTEFGLPNYFDEQRFGSYTGESGFIGKHIMRRDAEAAVKTYLSEKMVGDPERVRVFKEFAAAHWGDWPALMEKAPKPSNFRSVLTYLKDHPQDGWRKALNLIPANLLALYLSAYQSWLWNLIVARYLQTELAGASFALSSIRVAGQDLPVYRNLPESLRAKLERLLVPLPNHQARWPDPALDAAATAVLAAERLMLNDFKARILKRAFVSRSTRPLVVRPADARAGSPENDELARRRWKATVEFTLPPGSYATIVLKAVAA